MIAAFSSSLALGGRDGLHLPDFLLLASQDVLEHFEGAEATLHTLDNLGQAQLSIGPERLDDRPERFRLHDHDGAGAPGVTAVRGRRGLTPAALRGIRLGLLPERGDWLANLFLLV